MKLFRLMLLINVAMVTKCNDIQYSNETLLAEEINDSLNFTCLLEGNSLKSAVTWNAPFENYADLKASRYLPESKIICSYTGDKTMQDKMCVPPQWSVNQAVDFAFKPITDYRWEIFPIVTSSKSKRKQLYAFSKNTFSITLSLRIKNNAAVYLCDSQNDTKDIGCYMVLINKTTISLDNGQQTALESTTITELNEDVWANLSIGYFYKQMLMLNIADTRITWKTGENALNIRFLSVQSSELALWKVQNYWFLSTNKAVNWSQIGRKMLVFSNPFCISLYVALCSTCVVNMTIDSGENTEVYSRKVEHLYPIKISGETYSWKEVKVTADINIYRKVNLFLAVTNTNGSTEGFWAIDNLRLCHANEIRISNLVVKKNIANEIKCQPLLGTSISVSQTILTTGCPEDTKIGIHCNITCERILGKDKKWCERNMICKGKDRSSHCRCARGYQGDTCKDECTEGTLENRCSNKCGNCKNNNCNPNTRSCEEGCEDGFAPLNCRNPKPVSNIRTTNTTSNSITIEWDSPAPFSSRIFTYNVTYEHKKYRACKNNQQNAITFEISADNWIVVADNLLPYSEYDFTVATIHNGIRGSSTTYTASTTSTDTPDNEEVPIDITVPENQTGKFPLILLGEPRCSNVKGPLTYKAKFNCSDGWCDRTVTVLNIPYTNNLDNEKVFEQAIGTLTPYSNYTVTITTKRTRKNHNKRIMLQTEFKTSGGKPPAVSNLTAYSRNESTIWLRWKAPYPPHGQLERYKVKYIGINTSQSLDVQPTQCELWDNFTCAYITNLNKNMRYILQVQAKNSDVLEYGDIHYIRDVLTQEKASEPPSIVKVQWDKDTAILEWDHPVITNGPLIYFSIEINVIQSENFNHSDFYSNFTIAKYNRTYYKVLDLKYSTIYNVRVYPMNKFTGKTSKIVTIMMPPPTPKLLHSPTLSCIDANCLIQIPKPVNISIFSYLYVIVNSNPELEEEENSDIKQLLINSAKNEKRRTGWLAIATPVTNVTNDFIKVKLGDGTTTASMYGMAINKPLRNDTHYRVVTVIIANYFLNKTRFSPKYNIHGGDDDRTRKFSIDVNTRNIALYALFLLLLVPIAVCGWVLCKRKKKTPKHKLSLSNRFQVLNDQNPEMVPLTTSIAKKHQEALTQSQLCLQPTTAQYTCMVQLQDFGNYIKNTLWLVEDGELNRQYSLFVQGKTKPAECGVKEENRIKNIDDLVVPYDYNRVVLEKIDDDEFSDYINASYIEGHKKPKAYIATQHPTTNTVNDFWRMAWQENVSRIVMLGSTVTSDQEALQYWPKLKQTLRYGSISVYHTVVESFGVYIRRTFQLYTVNEQRIIQHLHFVSWPEHEIPVYPQTLAPFLKIISSETDNNDAPIIVHGKCGVGRTGTIILCDVVLKMARNCGVFDFLGTLQKMRDQRANMVSNIKQYKFAHLMIMEVLFGQDTSIVCDNKLTRSIKPILESTTGLEEKLNYVNEVYWIDQVIYGLHNNLMVNNNKKFPSVLSYTEVDGFNCPAKFVVAQQPVEHLWFYFWKLVDEKDVTTIVSLNDVNYHHASYSLFWPTENTGELKLAKSITVKYIDKKEYDDRDIVTVALVYADDDNEKQYEEPAKFVTIIAMKRWAHDKLTPKNIGDLLKIWEEMDKITEIEDHIMITCRDAITASGVFVALSFIFDKISAENLCDVCLAVRMVRRTCHKFIKNKEQLELLYKAALQYITDFRSYTYVEINSTNY